jgi:hypothetical protein
MSIERKLQQKHQGLTSDEIEGIKIILGFVLLFIFLVWFGSTVQGTRLIGF